MIPKLYFPTIRDLPASPLRRILDGFLNLIYPESCFLCGVPVARSHDCGICAACWQKILALEIRPPICPSCGLPLPNFEPDSAHLCGRCLEKVPPFAGARSFGHYSGEMRRLMQGLKFDGRRNLVHLLAPLLAAVFCRSWDRSDFDYIVAVPLHPRRRRERGFNQSELLARALAIQVAVPRLRALQRLRPTRPQVGLTDSLRRDNVRNAFRCVAPEKIARRRILLVDDVMTTGATVASATEALLDAGAASVSVLTAARASR